MDIKLHTARSTDRPEVARIFEAMDAAHLLHTPIADWPPQALASARELVASPEGLMSLRQASNKKAQVVQFVMARRLA